MHVLRAEKGYPIIGQETDGTVTPQDLGLGWAGLDEEGLHRPALAAPAGHACGRTASSSSACCRSTPTRCCPRAPSWSRPTPTSARVPVPMLGHVTSSYRSAALGRTFALALVKGGRDRIGERVSAPLADRVVEAAIADAVLFDPENRAPRRRSPRHDATIERGHPRDGPAGAGDAAGRPRGRRPAGTDRRGADRGPADGRRTRATAATDGEGHVLWLGPDEWLVVARKAPPAEVAPPSRPPSATPPATRSSPPSTSPRTASASRSPVPGAARPPRVRLRAGPRARAAGRRLRPDAARARQRRPVACRRRSDARVPRPRPALVRALPFGLASGRARGVTRKGRT